MFGDSIVSNVRKKEMERYVKHKVSIKAFGGATAADMETYVKPTLERTEKTDIAIIHVGTNDVSNIFRSKNNNHSSSKEIAETIINSGKICKDRGVKCVVISSLIKRKGKTAAKIAEVNNLLEKYAHGNGFHFINHKNVGNDQNDLARDGLHLNMKGTRKLANNLINKINEL